MELIFVLITIFLIGVLLYTLYICGFMVINAKSAVLFIGSAKRVKNSWGATFQSCNGYIKKVIRFKEEGENTFSFENNITKGLVTAELQDVHKKPVLLLDCNNTAARVNVKRKSRYYLILRFTNADGKCELSWNR